MSIRLPPPRVVRQRRRAAGRTLKVVAALSCHTRARSRSTPGGPRVSHGSARVSGLRPSCPRSHPRSRAPRGPAGGASGAVLGPALLSSRFKSHPRHHISAVQRPFSQERRGPRCCPVSNMRFDQRRRCLTRNSESAGQRVARRARAPTFNGRASGSRVCWFEHDDGRLHGATTSEGLVLGLDG